MLVNLIIKCGDKSLVASFDNNIDALEVFDRLFNALIDGGEDFEVGLEVKNG